MLEQCAHYCEKEKGNRKQHMPVRKIRVGSRQWEARRWGSEELRESSGHPSNHPSLVSSNPSITYLFPKLDSFLWGFQGDFKKKVRRVIFFFLSLQYRFLIEFRGMIRVIQCSSLQMQRLMSRGVLASIACEHTDSSKESSDTIVID